MSRRIPFRKTTVIAAVVAISAALSAAACARHHHSHSPERAQKYVSHKVDHILDRVDASDAQKAKVHGVKDKLFVEYLAAHEGSKEAKKIMLAEWKSESPNATKLHNLADQRVAAYQKAIHETIDGMIEVHATLDKEQRAEISSHIEKRMNH